MENKSDKKDNFTNKALFHNMAFLADAIWELNPFTDNIVFIHDKLTPELEGHSFTFREALIFLESHTSENVLETFANVITPEFIQNLDEDYIFDSKTMIDGELNAMKCILTPSFDENGRVSLAYLTFQNVQMEIDQQQKASQSQLELDRLLSAVNCGIVQYTINTKQIILANDFAIKILGYSSLEEMKKLPFEKLVSPVFDEDLAHMNELVKTLNLDGDPIECEFRVLQKNGDVLTIFGSVRLISQNTGEPVIQHSLIDITESQKTIHRYKEISEILEGANMGLWYIIMGNGNPKFLADASTARLLGLDPKMDPEAFYNAWVDNIDEEFRLLLRKSMMDMVNGINQEISYTYHHPTRGDIIIRVGGLVNPGYTGKGIMFRGCFQDITEYNKRIEEQAKREKDERETLKAMASIYSNSYFIDFENNTYDEMNAFVHVHDYIESHSQLDLQTIINGVFRKRFSGVALDHALKFAKFSTLAKRLTKNTITSIELIDIDNNWVRLSFIRVGEFSVPLKKVLFVSQDIDEEKRKEENLTILLNTDELTGIYNRHAYETHIDAIEQGGFGDDLWLVSLDLNGLKTANDSKGHAAGDELLKATADCLSSSIGDFGKAYRTGGDEFAVILKATEKEAMDIFKKMENFQKKWKGSLNTSFSFSMGFVCSSEMPGKSLNDIEKEADKRMYKSKHDYYMLFGDRRNKRG